MSLLAELIARLTALTEENRQTQAGLVNAARDQVQTVLDQLRTTTVGSNSPLVINGLGQLESVLEKLAGANTLIDAGDQAITAYITGPLLGGAASAAGGRFFAWSLLPRIRFTPRDRNAVNAGRHRLVSIGHHTAQRTCPDPRSSSGPSLPTGPCPGEQRRQRRRPISYRRYSAFKQYGTGC